MQQREQEKLEAMRLTSICNTVKCEQYLDKTVFSYLSNLSSSYATNTAFLFPCLIPSAGFCMEVSKVCALKTFEQGFANYCALLGWPGAGKTSAMDICKNGLNDLESYLGINATDSHLVNGATMEAVVAYLAQLKTIAALWDESASQMCSFGMYKGKGGIDCDRAILNELFGCPSVYRRDLKGHRTSIKNPRLNMALLGHPVVYIKNLQEDRYASDGLLCRFLIVAPEPAYTMSAKIIATQSQMIPMSFVFLAIKLLNEFETCYKLDSQATEDFNSLNDMIKSKIRLFNTYDPYISAVISKSMQHILRLSGIIYMLTLVIKIFDEIPGNIDRTKLGDEFVIYIESKKESITFEIDGHSLKYATNYIGYVNKHRLILSGYNLSEESLSKDFYEMIHDLMENDKCFKSLDKLSKKILLSKDFRANSADFNKKNSTYNITNIIDSFKSLSEKKLVTLATQKSGNKSVTILTRIDPKYFSNSQMIAIKNYVPYEKYLAHYHEIKNSHDCKTDLTLEAKSTLQETHNNDDTELEITIPLEEISIHEEDKEEDVSATEPVETQSNYETNSIKDKQEPRRSLRKSRLIPSIYTLTSTPLEPANKKLKKLPEKEEILNLSDI